MTRGYQTQFDPHTGVGTPEFTAIKDGLYDFVKAEVDKFLLKTYDTTHPDTLRAYHKFEANVYAVVEDEVYSLHVGYVADFNYENGRCHLALYMTIPGRRWCTRDAQQTFDTLDALVAYQLMNVLD